MRQTSANLYVNDSFTILFSANNKVHMAVYCHHFGAACPVSDAYLRAFQFNLLSHPWTKEWTERGV